MRVHIEFIGCNGPGCYELDSFRIGEFTRENVAWWLDNVRGPDPIPIQPVQDFHAVCGDVDIPWSTEEAKKAYETFGPKAGDPDGRELWEKSFD